jgi:hypothetical protein
MGVALAVLFLMWFASGIVMMYWDFPSVRAEDRLERSPALDASKIRLSPGEALATVHLEQAQIRLNSFDGRPAYRLRNGREESIVYADTGEPPRVDRALMDRVAAAWTGQPGAPRVESIEEPDQWTVQGPLRNLRPLWKYSWPDGEHVYVSGATGEVVQYTTSSSRLWGYLGAVTHWMYFTPLRKNQQAWSQFVIWTSGIGTISAFLGLAVAVWMYSPRKKYVHQGSPTSIPYTGQKRWHTILGLVFGIAAATWAFSGMMSMDPFPQSAGDDRPGTKIARALRGRMQLDAFESKHPREVLGQLAGLAVKELELTSFNGEAVYLATAGRGDTRVVPVAGDAAPGFDADRVVAVLRKAAGASAAIRTISDYDVFYLDRKHQRPLPAILVEMNDADRTRYYIDPKTATVVGSYSSRSWMNRWLYHGLHSLDFPWLYKYRPLWDVVVISLMLGGTTLCVTSIVLTWRVVMRAAVKRML